MCLTVPGAIRAIREVEPGQRIATIDYGSTVRSANLAFTPEARVGDFVLVQAGFAIRVLRPDEADEALAYHRELAAAARAGATADGG